MLTIMKILQILKVFTDFGTLSLYGLKFQNPDVQRNANA